MLRQHELPGGPCMVSAGVLHVWVLCWSLSDSDAHWHASW